MVTWAESWGRIDWDADNLDAQINMMLATFPYSINLQDEKGVCGVSLAVQKSKKSVLEKLLAEGANTELGTEKGLPSALSIAFRNENTEFAEMLVKHGANVAIEPVLTWSNEQKASFEKTKKDIWKNIKPDDLKEGRALETALERGDKVMAMIFASRGAPVNNHQDGKPSAIDIAIKNNDIEMFNYLIYVSRDPVDVNDRTARSESYLTEALKLLPQSRNIVDRLLDENADVNNPNDGTNWRILCEKLERATTPKEQKIVQEIAKRMIDNDITMDGITTPQNKFIDEYNRMFDPVSPEKDPIIGWKDYNTLIKLGAAQKVNNIALAHSTPVAFYNDQDLHNMMTSGDSDQMEVAKTWIAQDLAVDGEGNLATKVCFNAIENKDKGTLKKFLDLGVNPNTQKDDGNTFLHEAAKIGDKDIGLEIINHSADINRKNKAGLTPLMISVSVKNTEFTDELLSKRNIDLNAQDNDLFTALHYAVSSNDRETVEKLLTKGVLVNAQTKDGDTALHIAAKKGYSDIAKILIEAGADINLQNGKQATACSVADIDFANMIKEEADKRDLKVIEKKYGIVLGQAIWCGGKAFNKVCSAWKNFNKPNSNGR